MHFLLADRRHYKGEGASAHWALRLVPDFTAVLRFASRRNTVSTRAATISFERRIIGRHFL
jgi:hypothetical protein